jgi:hypothetical protein
VVCKSSLKLDASDEMQHAQRLERLEIVIRRESCAHDDVTATERGILQV